MAGEVEDRIREYLKLLGTRSARPKKVVDREAVDALRKRIAESDDPIEQLRLHTELERARQPRLPDDAAEREELEEHFVAHAKEWADGEGISPASFTAVKVPADVLRRAGFTVGGRSRRGGGGGGPQRSSRIPMEDVLAAARELPKTWPLKALATALDRDVATTRNYLKRLLDDGAVEEVGEDASGQGRPAKIYALTRR